MEIGTRRRQVARHPAPDETASPQQQHPAIAIPRPPRTGVAISVSGRVSSSALVRGPATSSYPAASPAGLRKAARSSRPRLPPPPGSSSSSPEGRPEAGRHAGGSNRVREPVLLGKRIVGQEKEAPRSQATFGALDQQPPIGHQGIRLPPRVSQGGQDIGTARRRREQRGAAQSGRP